MEDWRPTTGMIRALVLGCAGTGLGVLLGGSAAVVLAAPFVLLATFGLLGRPVPPVAVAPVLDHLTLHEAQGTTSRLVLEADGVEHVTRAMGRAGHVALHPALGAVGGLVSRGVPVLEVSPRRWGRRRLADEKIALTSRWAGFRWGPASYGGSEIWTLPSPAPFDARAEAPHPVGLVGAHRSRRRGDGSEFADIRAFHAGDRLRRINWRVSLRSGDLHVVASRAEEDTGVLLVVDALADHGRSGGVDGEVSSLDATVRGASALAEYFVRSGDRVAMRVVGGARPTTVGYGGGRRHLRRLQTELTRIQPGDPGLLDHLRLRVTAGTVVLVLSPMLSEAIVTTTASLARRALPVLVVDTLPPDLVPAIAEGGDPRVAALAWRMRLTDREGLLGQLARIGCPVVPWRGPGTLDLVLHRLARHAQLPRVAAR